MTWVLAKFSPGIVQELTEAVKLLQKMSTLANAANVAGAAGNAAKLLELSKAIIDDQTTGDIVDAIILKGLGKVKYNKMKIKVHKFGSSFLGNVV